VFYKGKIGHLRSHNHGKNRVFGLMIKPGTKKEEPLWICPMSIGSIFA
jgi:hypothetical protein